MNPNYNLDLIKEEIQSINSESTQKNNYFEIIGNQIITDLSNENTSLKSLISLISQNSSESFKSFISVILIFKFDKLKLICSQSNCNKSK